MSKYKFNVLDVVVIIVIIAAVAVGGYIFLKFNKAAMLEGTPRTVEFSVEVLDLTLDMANSFKDNVGAPVVYGTTNSDSGDITNVVVEPYMKIMRDVIDGEYTLEQYANKYMATVTIKAQLYETETAYMGVKEQVMIGSAMPFRGKGFAAPQCFIVDMTVEGEK